VRKFDQQEAGRGHGRVPRSEIPDELSDQQVALLADIFQPDLAGQKACGWVMQWSSLRG